MKSIHRKAARPVLLAALLGGGLCAAPVVSAGDAPSGNFAAGAKAWADNCSRCHDMRDPKEFRDDLWKPVVTHMRVRAGLTGQEARDILTFLQGSN